MTPLAVVLLLVAGAVLGQWWMHLGGRVVDWYEEVFGYTLADLPRDVLVLAWPATFVAAAVGGRAAPDRDPDEE